LDEPEETSWEADEREEEATAEPLTEREEEAIAELFEEREEETTAELFEESGESPRKLFSKWKRACRTKRYREEIGRQRNAWIKGWWKWKRR
jgi:hypothetical protein